jgi:bifunctional non-homologous end joining protein LigD
MQTHTVADTVTLYYREGSSDKIYKASVEPSDNGFVVNFAFGRRGSTLQTGTKTPAPVAYPAAKKVFDKLVQEKTAKGYTPGEDGTPYQQTAKEGRATGLLPQLLNSITEAEAETLIADQAWWAQEKFDGRRILIRKRGQEVHGINRTGLLVSLPVPVVEAVRGMLAADQCLLDGEAVGDVYHVFDALEREGVDLRLRPYAERYAEAMDLADGCVSNSVWYAPVATEDATKRALLKRLKAGRKEGVVFKRHDAPYTAGRPASGGTQLKLKFTATCSCIVAGTNGNKRSVRLELLDDAGRPVGVGNVTIPPNSQMPIAGQIVETRYLYAYQGGSLYQPLYLGPRDDVTTAECRLSQLKFRPEEPDAEG